MNNQYQEGVKETPFMLNFGQHPRSPLTLTVPREYTVPAVQHWHGRMHETLKVAKAALQASQNRYAAYSRTKRRDVDYAVGQQVLLNTKNIKLKGAPDRRPDGTRKLMPKFIGPFQIIKKVGKVAYKLDLPENMRP